MRQADRGGKGSGAEVSFIGGTPVANDALRLVRDGERLVAFAGRSNVGKSSLLNALTKTKVARISSEPGKTRELNFFRWKDWVLVDLPGYGYAKVSKALREQWGREITAWLSSESRLRLVVALVDGRHGYFETDLELLGLLREQRIPHVVAFTKMDKWKSASQRRQAERELSTASRTAGIGDFLFLSSAEKGGISSLRELLRKVDE